MRKQLKKTSKKKNTWFDNNKKYFFIRIDRGRHEHLGYEEGWALWDGGIFRKLKVDEVIGNTIFVTK